LPAQPTARFPELQLRILRQRLPPCDDADVFPRLGGVGDTGETPKQLHRGGRFAALPVGNTDRSSLGLGHAEHEPESMGSPCLRLQATCRNKTLTAKPEPQNRREESDMAAWDVNWAWGLPLIVLTVVIHVLGLGLLNERIVTRVGHRANPTRVTALFVVIMAAAALMVAAMHAIEGTMGGSLSGLGALPDFRKAMLYSFGAITSYGHASMPGATSNFEASLPDLVCLRG
jgi:hypothetical protein